MTPPTPPPAFAQSSTVLSDGLLALVCIGCAGRLYYTVEGPHRVAAIGILSVGLAAAAGSVRFSGVHRAVPIHEALSNSASAVGMALVGACWVATVTGAQEPLALALTLVLVLAQRIARGNGWAWWPRVAATAGMIGAAAAGGMVLGAQPTAGALGIGGAATIALAGLVIGTEGKLAGLPRIDWFHGALAGGLIALTEGLRLLSVH